MNRREIEEQLEACRADSHDLSRDGLRDAADRLQSDEELADRFEKQQRCDSQIAQTMREVAAPAGLADRILSRLENASAADADSLEHDIAAPLSLAEDFEPAAEHDSTAESEPPASKVTPATRHRRRSRLAAMALATTTIAACLLVAVFVGEQGPSIVDEARFEEEVDQWRQLVDTDAWETEPDLVAKLIERHPLHDMAGGQRVLRPAQVVRPESHADEVAVFDYSFGRQTAYLFVAETQFRTKNMPSTGATATAVQTTAGWSYAAWHDGERLYVMMFQGDPGDLRRYVPSVGDIARREARFGDLIFQA